MRQVLYILATLAIAAQAYAAPPTVDQKRTFYDRCFSTSQNEALCTCKADAAMHLVDFDFMGVILEAMKDGAALEEKYYDAYNDYIARSTEACGMGGI